MQYSTIRQGAKTLGLPECILRKMVKSGTLPGFYSGTRFYVDLDGTRETLSTIAQKRGDVVKAVEG